jgi:hypothetical protein
MAKIKLQPQNNGHIAAAAKEAPAKKGGRPTKKSSKADKRVSFYLTEEAFNGLKRKALEHTMSPGKYVKHVLIASGVIEDI